MLMNYGVMYAYADSGQFKAPFKQIFNEARVFTPKDTAVVTPNSDTPYSMLFMDLRAEPIVLCVPKKKTMSAAARKKIAAAQKARWAKVKTAQKKSA